MPGPRRRAGGQGRAQRDPPPNTATKPSAGTWCRAAGASSGWGTGRAGPGPAPWGAREPGEPQLGAMPCPRHSTALGAGIEQPLLLCRGSFITSGILIDAI